MAVIVKIQEPALTIIGKPADVQSFLNELKPETHLFRRNYYNNVQWSRCDCKHLAQDHNSMGDCTIAECRCTGYDNKAVNPPIKEKTDGQRTVRKDDASSEGTKTTRTTIDN
jgi:hypothetical protein